MLGAAIGSCKCLWTTLTDWAGLDWADNESSATVIGDDILKGFASQWNAVPNYFLNDDWGTWE